MRNKLSLIRDIQTRLSAARIELFRQTCFGPWLQLSDFSADPVLLYTFFDIQEIPAGPTREEMYFRIGTHLLRFSREEFCLTTGLLFGSAPNDPTVSDGFARRTFGDRVPKLEQVQQIFSTIGGAEDHMEDVDAVKVCLMLMVHMFFIGHRKHVKVSPLVIKAIDNMDFWNSYPWGSLIWDITIRQMYRCLATGHRTPETKVTIYGFVFALKVS